MPLAWVMQSCSICSGKVFGWRRSDSFPEHVLSASRLPELERETFKQISNLSGYESTYDWQRDADVMTVGQTFERATLGGFYVHHWEESIAIQDQFCSGGGGWSVFGDSRYSFTLRPHHFMFRKSTKRFIFSSSLTCEHHQVSTIWTPKTEKPTSDCLIQYLRTRSVGWSRRD